MAFTKTAMCTAESRGEDCLLKFWEKDASTGEYECAVVIHAAHTAACPAGRFVSCANYAMHGGHMNWVLSRISETPVRVPQAT